MLINQFLFRRFLIALSVTCLLITHQVHARMYQWVEPDTGTTQLSGKPPTWYRGQEAGPRVLVFEKGRLVDDTDIEVSEKVKLELRRKAFVMAEQDEQAAKEKLTKSLQIKDAYKESQTSVDEVEQFEQQAIEEEQASADDVINELKKLQNDQSEDEDLAEQQMAERLKEMIQVWEDSQKAEAVNQIQ